MNRIRQTALCRAWWACLVIACCFATGVNARDEAPAPAKPRPAAAPWRFAEAMERRAPLQRVVGAPGSARTAPCATAPSESAQYDEALEYARGMGSYSLLIWRAGRCELAHYFPPFTSELRPESASMHKTVLALLIAAAIADGHIDSADDSAGKYLHPWRDEPMAAVTLRDLLTMSSGLEPFSREGGTASPGWRFIMGEGNIREMSLSRPLKHPPGTVFNYDGLNSQVLLQVLEAATGTGYVDFLQRRLWQPLGADDAYVWVYNEPPGMPRGYSALLATAQDWLRIGLLIKDRGMYGGNALLPGELVDAMTSPSAANPNYGWQLWLGTRYEAKRYYSADKSGVAMAMAEPFAVPDMIYLDGIGGQRVYISRSLDLVIVREGDSRLDWDDAYLPNLIIRSNDEGAQL